MKNKKQEEVQPRTLADRVKEIEKLEKVDIPWNVKRSGIVPSLYGAQVCFTNDGDFLTLEEAQDVVKFLANQLGLEVK